MSEIVLLPIKKWGVTIPPYWKMFYSNLTIVSTVIRPFNWVHLSQYTPWLLPESSLQAYYPQSGRYSFHLMLHDLNAVCICEVIWTCFAHVLCECGRQDNYLPNINNGTSGIPTWHLPRLIANLWLKCEIVLGALSRGSTKHRRHREHIIVVIIVVNTAPRDV